MNGEKGEGNRKIRRDGEKREGKGKRRRDGEKCEGKAKMRNYKITYNDILCGPWTFGKSRSA